MAMLFPQIYEPRVSLSSQGWPVGPAHRLIYTDHVKAYILLRVVYKIVYGGRLRIGLFDEVYFEPRRPPTSEGCRFCLAALSNPSNKSINRLLLPRIITFKNAGINDTC